MDTRDIEGLSDGFMRLAAIGWVEDKELIPVPGCRLRWHFPAMTLDASGKPVGLPEWIEVERAEVPSEGGLIEWDVGHAPSVQVPAYLWEKATTFLPRLPLAWSLDKGPAQAVFFEYTGADNIVELYSSNFEPVLSVSISDGQRFFYEAPDIAVVRLLVADRNATPNNLYYLNLFTVGNRLSFTRIARISGEHPFSHSSPLADIKARLNNFTTLEESEWSDIAQRTRAFYPGGSAYTPEDFHGWAAVIALEWELSVLVGSAFFDGPRSAKYVEDQIETNKALTSPPSRILAYRVTSSINDVQESNVAFVPDGVVNPLIPLSSAAYSKLVVEYDGSLPDASFVAAADFKASVPDRHAAGGVVEEKIVHESGETSDREPLRLLPSGPKSEIRTVEATQQYQLAHPADTLSMRSRTFDHWGRVSPWTHWDEFQFSLQHWPQPPRLASARYIAKSQDVEIVRAIPDPDWQPDPVVALSSRMFVEFLHAKGSTRIESYSIASSGIVSESEFKLELAKLPSKVISVGATGLIRGQPGVFVSVNKRTVTLRLSEEDLLRCPHPLPADTILEVPVPQSWEVVHTIRGNALRSLPTHVRVPVTASGTTANLASFACRVGFQDFLEDKKLYGQRSNTVQTMVWPALPAEPEPFTVTLLGRDTDNRLGVRLTFATNISKGRFSIAWSPANPKVEFSERAVAGTLPPQETQDGRFLFDVLDIPETWHFDQSIEVGVKQISEGGFESDYTTTVVKIEAS